MDDISNPTQNLYIPSETAIQLLEAATSWIGHGRWQIESTNIVWSDINRDKFTEFMILFADYSNGFSPKEVLRSYIDKTMTMNCWQFVLVCMYDAKLIDRIDICKLYYHGERLLTVVPVLFDITHTQKERPVPGDIILYVIDNKLKHTAICSSVIDTEIGIIDICNSPIRKIKEDYMLRQYGFNQIYYLDLDKVVESIKGLPPIDTGNGWIYNCIFNKSLCVFVFGLVCGYLGFKYVDSNKN